MPNTHLQAVLSRFAEQPGISAQQMALLYGTLASDAGLRQRLNQQAASGELKQLALEPAATASLIGRYDKTSGTVHLLLTALALTLVTACASHPLPAAPEPAAMTASTPPTTSPASVADNPALSVEEIGRRFLRLFEGLESRDDLTLEYVEQVVGVKLEADDEARVHIYGRELEGGWGYYLAYRPKYLKLENAVKLEFWHQTNEYAEMTPVCALNFEDYRRELERMGFIVHPIYGEIRELRSFRAAKALKNGDVISMTIIPQNHDTLNPEGKVGVLCVRSIGMSSST